jgi:hypothetical protein
MWTKKLLEIKQKNAAAAAAATGSTPFQSPLAGASASSPPTVHPTTAGKAPIPAGKAPFGLGAGKRPAGKTPLKNPQVAEALKNMPPEVLQQYLGKLKASQAMKRPLDSNSNGDGDGGDGGSSTGDSVGGSVLGEGEPPAKKVDVGAAKE